MSQNECFGLVRVRIKPKQAELKLHVLALKLIKKAIILLNMMAKVPNSFGISGLHGFGEKFN